MSIKLADVSSNHRSWLPSEQGAILGRYLDQIRLDSTTSTIHLELQKCYNRNEDEKKRMYNERILQVENATFTSLVFATKGGMTMNAKHFTKG